jgi:hypothetical protein
MMTMYSAPDHLTTSGDARTAPLLKRSIITGAIGFCLVSLCVFATVAFAQNWMYKHLSVFGAYIVWIALFILLGGKALSPLVIGPRRPLRFYALFGTAFFVYGISWMESYFTLPNTMGEWIGSLAGSVSMALVFAAGFKALRSTLVLSAVLFVANSIGYFGGLIFYSPLGEITGLLVWGAFYGLCLGAGLGAVIYIAQSQRASRQNNLDG